MSPGMTVDLFHDARFALIGMIHLPRLPEPAGPKTMEGLRERALRDARLMLEAGFDGLLVENFGDHPFYPDSVPPYTVAAMTGVVERLVKDIDLPVGVNVLRCDPKAALGIAAATGAAFVRLNVWPVMTDQGLLQGRAHETVRLRDRLCPAVKLWIDVGVKHGRSTAPSLAQEAADNVRRGAADALLVSGPATGAAADPADLEMVAALDLKVPLLLGSGLSADNLATYAGPARGAVVGTALKAHGRVENPVDRERARALVGARDEMV